MRSIDSIAEEMFNKIRNRFENVNIGDEQAKSTINPENARFFNFDFISSAGKNFGNVTISLIDGNSVKIYFSRNLTTDLSDEEKDEWFEFLKNIRKFSKRNMLSFDVRDISKDTLNHKDLKHAAVHQGVLKSDDINESKMYGNKKLSYQNLGPCKIIVKHTSKIDEEAHGARTRNIESIFIETSEGERFKLPFNKLSGARAMASHLANGGTIHDKFGEHISNIVKEMDDMKVFVRSMKNKTFEDVETKDMVESACDRYYHLKKMLNTLSGPKGYKTTLEKFSNDNDFITEIDDDSINAMRDRFVKKSFDERLSNALPHVLKAHSTKKDKNSKIAEQVLKCVKNNDQLISNISDVYENIMSAKSDDIIVKALESISKNENLNFSIVEFASTWSIRYPMISENSTDDVLQEKSLAIQLATKFLKEFNELKNSYNPTSIEKSSIKTAIKEYKNWITTEESKLLGESPQVRPSTDSQISKLSKILQNPLSAGSDGVNASSALEGIIEDDALTQKFINVAKDFPDTDVRSIVLSWLNEYEPNVARRISDMQKGSKEKTEPEIDNAIEKPIGSDKRNKKEKPDVSTENPNDITDGEDIGDIEDLQKLSGVK